MPMQPISAGSGRYRTGREDDAALCAAAGSGAYALTFSEAIAATQPEVVRYQPDDNRHQQLREGYARYLAVAQSLQGDGSGAMKPRLGIYEKALPTALDWPKRFEMAAGLAFDFIEISVDESPERQARLHWNRGSGWRSWRTKSTAALMPSMCLSAHRSHPFGSVNRDTRLKARELMLDALDFASHVGIRNIQLAGYDVHYESSSAQTRNTFIEGINWRWPKRRKRR